MGQAKILDCTLRDGAYLIDKKFGDDTIRGMIEGLVSAKLDFIEIGFFQDEGFGAGKTVFKNSHDARKFIPAEKKGSEFTVLADYSRYSVENLDDWFPGGIDAVRECFFKKERFDAIESCKIIKEKGYKLFVQPVDILGYTDKELVEFIDLVNEIEPYCISIVDTFGSMYQEDLHRVFELINHNLVNTCRIGFHSHNNMQLSNALSQEFIRMTSGKRDAIVDGTISGMGRGAGNTPTELIAQYMVAKQGANYDIDSLLDIIDVYMENIRTRCTWGYNTQYFIAGCYGAHVNNIAYLAKKNSIKSKDIRFILNKIGNTARKRYDYELLEETYLNLLSSDIDDSEALIRLKQEVAGRTILILVPGNTVTEYEATIKNFIEVEHPVIISVNFIHDNIQSDYIYMSNVKRYQVWKLREEFKNCKKIMTSNFSASDYDELTTVVSFARLVKCGWEKMDNSTIMLLRLLNLIDANKVYVAGFDGYSSDAMEKNYSKDTMEIVDSTMSAVEINKEISEMLIDINGTKRKDMLIKFITPSRFEKIFSENG